MCIRDSLVDDRIVARVAEQFRQNLGGHIVGGIIGQSDWPGKGAVDVDPDGSFLLSRVDWLLFQEMAEANLAEGRFAVAARKVERLERPQGLELCYRERRSDPRADLGDDRFDGRTEIQD